MALIPPSVPSGYHADMIDGGQPCSFNNATGALLVDNSSTLYNPGSQQVLGAVSASCNNAGNLATGHTPSGIGSPKGIVFSGNAALLVTAAGGSNLQGLVVPANTVITLAVDPTQLQFFGQAGLALVNYILTR